MMDLKGKVAVVTGASRGIGRAIAVSLASKGMSLVLLARTSDELAKVAEACRVAGGNARVVPTDVTKEAELVQAFEGIRSTDGRIDVLVNNAGIGRFAPVRQLNMADLDAMWSLNVRSVFRSTQLALPMMEHQRSGTIVNIASLAGKNAFVNGAGYASTKWALRAFAQCLMLEEREFNIRVVTICPGSVETSFSPRTSDPSKKDWIVQPEDVAETVLLAVTMPERAMVSEIDIRPTNPKG